MNGTDGENRSEDVLFDLPYSEVEPWLRGVHSFVATILMFASIIGNGLVFWLVVKNKELQYRSILASMGAITVNILFSLLTTPQVVAGSVTGEWPLGDTGCVAIGYIATSIFYVRWMNTLLIAVDRFFYIVTPFFYLRNSKPILVTLTVFVWTIPFITNVPSVVQETYSYRSSLTFCSVDCAENNICYGTYIILFAVYMIIGVVLPIIIYTFLYCYGKKKRRDMHRELGTHAAPTPPPLLNGNYPTDNSFLEHHPSRDLGSINEENEDNANDEEGILTHRLPFTTNHELDTLHEHKILNTSDLNSLQLELVSPVEEDGDEERLSHPQPVAEYDNNIQQLQFHNCRGSSDSVVKSINSPSHTRVTGQRRTSIVILSRAAITAGRTHVTMQLRERQATITFFIIFTNLVLTQILLFILSAVRRQSYYLDIPIWIHMISTNLFLLAPALDPIIIMRNKDFKKVLTKMFKRRNNSFTTTR